MYGFRGSLLAAMANAFGLSDDDDDDVIQKKRKSKKGKGKSI